MSVDCRTYVGKGWELTKERFEQVRDKMGSLEEFEVLLDNEFLHWVNSFVDAYPYFLGYALGSAAHDGEVISLELYENADKDQEIIQLAREVFGLISPPTLHLISEIY